MRAITSVLLAVLLVAGCGDGVDLARGDATAGAEVYRVNCAGCHGAAGEGADQGPPLVHEMYREDVFPDVDLVTAVRRGASTEAWDFPLMPAMPGLSGEDVSDVLAYVRELQAGS